jgi:hypothetical protein
MSEHSSTENFVDEVETVDSVQDPASAQETAQKPKKVIGRPITKETAKQYQLSAAAAKKRRKEARQRMLAALTDDLDLRQELLKAMKQKDEQYLNMIEKATKLVGLQWEQSDEGREQRLNVKSDSTVDAKVSMPSLNITFTDKKEAE